MEFAFPWPTSQGEWLAWSSAVVTLAARPAVFLSRRASPSASCGCRSSRRRRRRSPRGAAACRASISASACAASCLAQPLLYMALGFSWLFTAFGRLAVDDVGRRQHAFQLGLSIVVELVLAALAACLRLRLSALNSAMQGFGRTLRPDATIVPEKPCGTTHCGLKMPVLDGNRLSAGDSGSRASVLGKMQ